MIHTLFSGKPKQVKATTRQSGAALLAFMLVILTTASYLLLNQLNAHTNQLTRAASSQIALKNAKQALLLYAMNYPELRSNQTKGPGFLPCPDQDNDGLDDALNCSTAGIGATTGRLPFRILGLEDEQDSSGERLWYAVSNNFNNRQSDYTVINSETPGLLSVDGTADIVAVIIAPGTPVAAQSSRPSNNAADYLENDNATTADTSFVTTAAGEFNDQIITITRAELMSYVEKRVINEVRNFLQTYVDPNSDDTLEYAYPWLVPFSDPNTDYRILRGKHNGADNSASLTDTRRNFIEAGVAVNDVVRNTTDGSIGIVTAVTANTLTISGLSLGTENDFDNPTPTNLDNADSYFIQIRDLPSALTGTATAGSGGLTLEDTTKDFEEIALPGDVIENITDGSRGVIESVDGNTLVAKSLSAGAFNTNDSYRIRSNAGQATAGSAALTLEDTSVNFQTMGVNTGDMIENITDGSYGRVVTVTNATTLVVDALEFGSDNSFQNNDLYRISRFTSMVNTRYGLLPLHEAGRRFPSAFSADYSAEVADGGLFITSASGTQPVYEAALQEFVQSSTINGTINVEADNGNCTWTTPTLLECIGKGEQITYAEGTITAGVNTNVLTDSTKNFNQLGIKRGDLVQNYDDEVLLFSGTADAGSDGATLVDAAEDFDDYDPSGHYNLLVRNTSQAGKGQAILGEVVDEDTLSLVDYPGWGVDPINFSPGNNYSVYEPQTMIVTNVTSNTTLSTVRLGGGTPDFDAPEYYRIKSATEQISGQVDNDSNNELEDTSVNFAALGVMEGDIIENVTDGSFGEITNVNGSRLTTTLYGGSNNTFEEDDDYIVYYAYINLRQYIVNLRFNGSQTETANAGVRQRSVCLGYGADCTLAPADTTLPYHDIAINSRAALGSAGLTLFDAAINFVERGVVVGDAVINSTDGSTGIVETVTNNSLTVYNLNGGAENDFDVGEGYRITKPMVTLEDLSDGGTVVATGSIVVPSIGSLGYVRVTGLDYYLSQENGELPEWFLKNRWHELVYVAYSSEFVPGADGACTSGVDCLNLQGVFSTTNNNEVLVLSSGMELGANDRSSGLIGDYYELNNAIEQDLIDPLLPNDNYDKGDISGTFNDQLTVVSP